MSKRLQVLLPSEDMHRLKRLAQVKRVTVATWVREAIRKASLDQPEGGADRKLAALRAAAWHAFPTAGVRRMLADIDRGRSRGAPG